MASPFDARAPALFLPADWTDTDQRIIESLLLPPPGPEGEWTPRAVELPPKRVEQLLDAGEKGAAVAQAATPTPLPTPAPMAAPTRARSPGDKKARGSRRRVTIEEKRMKHREVQRRFMQRKKEAIAQVKQSIGALEQQLRLMKLAAERAALEAENSALQAQVDAPARGQEELLRKFLLEIPLVEKIFRPVTAERWEEIACQTLSCIDGIFSDCSLRSTGFSVLGWTDHRDVQDSTVKFTLSKSFPNVCAEQLWNRSWERISTDSYASFFSPSLHVRKHLLQQVCDDAIIIYRGICYPQTARISRAVEIISRVRRADDFIFFIRSLDVAEVRQELSTPDVWTQSLTALRFTPTDPEHPESGCTVHYGGSYENIPTGGIRYWLMEILFLVLRFESALISPMFALCE